MFHLLPGFLQSALAFVVVLGVLVFVHEFGHYAAARWRGVHVEVFSIGFGHAIASWKDRVGTTWKLAWLPLGGYVKLHGLERPETVSAETQAGWILPSQTWCGFPRSAWRAMPCEPVAARQLYSPPRTRSRWKLFCNVRSVF